MCFSHTTNQKDKSYIRLYLLLLWLIYRNINFYKPTFHFLDKWTSFGIQQWFLWVPLQIDCSGHRSRQAQAGAITALAALIRSTAGYVHRAVRLHQWVKSTGLYENTHEILTFCESFFFLQKSAFFIPMSNICRAFVHRASQNAILKWPKTNLGYFCGCRTKTCFYRSIKQRGVMEDSLTRVSKHSLKDCILVRGHHSLKAGENSSEKELTLNGKQTSKQMVRWRWLLLVHWTKKQQKTHLIKRCCWKSETFLLFLFNRCTKRVYDAASGLHIKGQWSGSRAWMFDETQLLLWSHLISTSNCKSQCSVHNSKRVYFKKANIVPLKDHKGISSLKVRSQQVSLTL